MTGDQDSVWPNTTNIRSTDANARRLAGSIYPGASLIEVPASPNMPLGNCYWNVDATIQKFGGTPVLGWAFEAWPGKYIAAMHHAIWRSPNGELLDVTQKVPTITESHFTTFLPDERTTIDLDKLPNIRSRHLVTSISPQARAFVRAYDEKNLLEREFADAMYALGYRCEAQRAMALGTQPSIRPEVIQRLHQLHQSSLVAEIERARAALGNVIIRLRGPNR